ncbi:MAG: hypothetical protein DI605_20705 [Sphingomonas sp.]|nr:MAG: hypothetical protein DI605_20705 [Sphingomonas sp.]
MVAQQTSHPSFGFRGVILLKAGIGKCLGDICSVTLGDTAFAFIDFRIDMCGHLRQSMFRRTLNTYAPLDQIRNQPRAGIWAKECLWCYRRTAVEVVAILVHDPKNMVDG